MIKRPLFKILTLASLALANFSAAASVARVDPQTFKTHYRLNIFAPKDRLVISKEGKTVQVQTLDQDLFSTLQQSFSQISTPNEYLSKIEFNPASQAGPMSVVLTLQKNEIELFSFYKETESKHVIDFWLPHLIEDKVSSISSAESPANTQAQNQIEVPMNQADLTDKTVTKSAAPIKELPKAEKKVITPVETAKKAKEVPDFRDFRYGGAFIWDYSALIPEYNKSLNLERKTPEFYFPIADRAYDKDEKEAHMQLTINLYRKEKYGLMNKSISLYEKKYGEEDSNKDMNDYLKANSLLRENIKEPNVGIMKSAVNILTNIADRSTFYEMQKGIWQFLIAYNIENKDFISALQVSKTLYVETKSKFDRELSESAAEVILYCLAELAQIEKIDAFIEEKSIKKLIPEQLALSYKSYVLLFRDKSKEVVELFEKHKIDVQKAIHPALVFNAAEAYFRLGNYEKAIKFFDRYIVDNSFNPKSSFARVRLALSYEILGKDMKLVLELYKNAINRSSAPEARYEAKLRYTAIRLARKTAPGAEEKETALFLEHDVDETKALTPNLKNLLWLVRLRTFINQGHFDEALAYLSSLPLDAMRPSERRTFEGDGAEIIYGLIHALYNKGDHSKLLKVWETYSGKYIDKVAMDPKINFLICNSYLRMKLYDSFDRALDKFRDLSTTTPRTFPIWIERGDLENQEVLIRELAVLKSIYAKDWVRADEELSKIKDEDLKKDKVRYYRGIISYHKKDYTKAVDNIERFLVNYENERALPDEEVAQLLEVYYESLYALGRIEKFEVIVKALIKDLKTKKEHSAFMLDGLERMSYLLIETMAGDNNKENDAEVPTYIEDFQQRFGKSIYTGRVKFLQAQSLIKFNKVDEGLSILKKLLEDNTVPSYIKELSRAELSSIQLQRRSI